MRNLIDENHFLRKYKERTRQWRQVAGHKDSFVEGQNQVELEIETEGVRNIILNLEYNIEEV